MVLLILGIIFMAALAFGVIAMIIYMSTACPHEFGKWQVWKALQDNLGNSYVFQARTCKKCGLTEHRKDVV